MGITDTLSSIGSTANQNIGNVEKAILEVVDLRNRETVRKNAVVIVQGSGVGSISDRASSMGGSMMNSGLLNDYVGNLVDATMKLTQDSIDDKYLEKLADNKKYFTVQFNPSSLRLSGHSGGPMSMLDFDEKKDDEATYTYAQTSISMSVDLLFDSMDTQDAFMSDKISSSPTDMAKGIANIALTATDKKQTSVQRKVEGLIGALRNENTRLITFHWGDISYSGVLKSIGAEYTMFNVNGEPVRAVVNMQIMCADASVWPNSIAVWQERYKEAFSGGSESFVKASQKVGNLLNF